MPLTLPRFFLAALLFFVLGIATAAEAQQAPDPKAPDVTTLPAPSGASTTTLPAPAAPGSGEDDAAPAAAAAQPSPCGAQSITIARMPWPSAAILAEIHARILKAEFGCTVQVLPSDLAPALSGMAATGQPAVVPEMWETRAAEQWNQAIKDQKLRPVGLTYGQSDFEGWFVPDYVAASHPELKSVAALKDDWKLFSGGGDKGKLVSCPLDWACAIINRNLLKAQGLDQLFTVVEPKNRFDLDQMIAAAVSRKEPILFYYWAPNATLSQFSFKPVDLGPYDKDAFLCLGKRACAAPKPSGFPPEPVVIALAEWVFTGAPEVAAYFQRAQMPLDVMNGLLAQLNVTGQTPESVADKFVAEQQDLWQKWAKPPTASAPQGGGAPAQPAPASTPKPARQPAPAPDRPATPQFVEPIIKY
jgi:glycine betaine/proline transport system substrate-binding protein